MSKKFLMVLAPLVVMVSFAVSGITAGSALARHHGDLCAEAAEVGVNGNWEKRVPNNLLTGVCEVKVAVGAGKYLKIEKIEFNITSDEACALAEEPLVVGNYEDNECTKKVALGKGKYVKIITSPCTEFVLCNNSNVGLRDDLVEPPEGGSFGTDALAVNTQGPLRLCEKFKAAVGCEGVKNQNPINDAFFGLKLHENPTSANCHTATGWVEWADIQNATSTGGVSSPVFAGTSPGDNGAWSLSVRSDKCSTNPGRVSIDRFAIYIPVPGFWVTTPSTGEIVGKYIQPSAQCAAGGVELNIEQTLEINDVSAARTIDNGTTGVGAASNAFICFVSANNYVYPKTGPEWKELQGAIWKD